MIETGCKRSMARKAPHKGEQMTFTTQEIHAGQGGKDIFGVLYTPAQGTAASSGGAFPLVIFSHGFGASHQLMRGYAEAAARLGFAAYIFDFCGGSTASRSSGSNLSMSIFTEQEDLRDVIALLSARPDIDPERLFLCGESQGGLVSALTAAAMPDSVRGLILLYPALCIPDDARRRFASVAAIKDVNTELWMPVGRSYYERLLDFDVFARIGAYKKPVLIIHGSKDEVVNESYSHRAQKEYKDAELHIIEGAGHGFPPGAFFEEARQLMEAYLLKAEGTSAAG